MPFQMPTDHFQPFSMSFLQSNLSPLSLGKFERQTIALKKITRTWFGSQFHCEQWAAYEQVSKLSEPDEVSIFIKE